jgi:hypothetical protein
VTFDAVTGRYTYRYSVANDASSAQEVNIFAVDFVPPISNIRSPQGWAGSTHDTRNTVEWYSWQVAPAPPGEVDRGDIPPAIHQIKPGAFLAGFSYESPNPSGSVNYYVTGYVPLPSARLGELEAEEIEEACVESTGPFFNVAVVGATQGPVTFAPVQIRLQPGRVPIKTGTTVVAILASPAFDATRVDATSVRFGPGGAKAKGAGRKIDVNGDGRLDLVLEFDSKAAAISCQDQSGTLIGKTRDGKEFRGSDGSSRAECQ